MVSLQSTAPLWDFPHLLLLSAPSPLTPRKQQGKADTRDSTLTAAAGHLSLSRPSCGKSPQKHLQPLQGILGNASQTSQLEEGKEEEKAGPARCHSCLTQDVPWAHSSFYGGRLANDKVAHRADGALCQSPKTVVPEYFWLSTDENCFP